MAFEGMTFNLYTDTACTIAFSGVWQLVHNTNLSDNPQEMTLYLGSPTAGRLLQTTTNPGVDNITLTPTDVLPEWQASHAYIVGNRVQAVGGDGFVYQCTVAGTTGASEPTWPTGGFGSTVIDGTCTWEKYSAKHEITEVILGLSSGDLDTNTPGTPLDVATSIDGDDSNAIPIYFRVNNAVTNVSNNTGYGEIAIYINNVTETST